MSMNWHDTVVIITGGTGSLGRKLTEVMLKVHKPRKLIIFSRDELKQYEMSQMFPAKAYPSIRFFIGDVRDRERLYRAFDGVDLVIHAAALKQVPTAEYNPLEAIRTNILGAANIVDAAIDRNVKSVIALSTDKATNPINLYGATKLCSDKLFVAANNYVGVNHVSRFSVVRYGNVVGSRGSVVPFFLKARAQGWLPITDSRMTRFWITIDQAAHFVCRCVETMEGGEIFVPKIPSMSITDLAKAIAPECRLKSIGIRPGEKLHEALISEDDARNTIELDDCYAILPDNLHVDKARFLEHHNGRSCREDFSYTSDRNTHWLSVAELRTMLGLGIADPAVPQVRKAA
jgi:UDP-N-acetylglucosamine 4,6-dehydratase/5-epimerase